MCLDWYKKYRLSLLPFFSELVVCTADSSNESKGAVSTADVDFLALSRLEARVRLQSHSLVIRKFAVVLVRYIPGTIPGININTGVVDTAATAVPGREYIQYGPRRYDVIPVFHRVQSLCSIPLHHR